MSVKRNTPGNPTSHALPPHPPRHLSPPTTPPPRPPPSPRGVEVGTPLYISVHNWTSVANRQPVYKIRVSFFLKRIMYFSTFLAGPTVIVASSSTMQFQQPQLSSLWSYVAVTREITYRSNSTHSDSVATWTR